jgi:uncharacterized phage protein (TIGR01671 family)
MRELKFRAWLKPRWDDDEDADKMYYDIQNSYDTLGDVKPYDLMDSFDQWLDDDVAIVEQFTGLKDKNGKEIYEGDIVEEEIDCGDDDIDGTYRYTVVWDEDTLCWSLSPQYGAIHEDLWETNSSIKIVGNIHETHELLKEEE